MMKRINTPQRKKEMRNAPFVFNPADWYGFFAQQGWQQREVRYTFEESEKLGRQIPLPWIGKVLMRLFPKSQNELKNLMGYVVLEPKK